MGALSTLLRRNKTSKGLPTLEQLTEPAPSPGPHDWNDDGVVILKNFMPESLMTAYEALWERTNGSIDRRGGWKDPVPYMRHEELKDILLYKPLADQLAQLLQGEQAGLHLNLTGWVTTTRDWHQDSYLNPGYVGDSYAAVWMAFDDIHPDSGPFQYIPGSHRWNQVTQERLFEFLAPEEKDHRWPTYSERILTPFFENLIEERKPTIVDYLPSRGDVLIWHGRLLHRGSRARVPNMERRALIAHYSGVDHRPDFPVAVQHGDAGWYFPIEIDLSVFYPDGEEA